jgi:hypothetical protein
MKLSRVSSNPQKQAMEAIQLYDKIQDPIAGIEKLGNFFAKSGMFGCEKVEQGAILAMACWAERKSPLEITKKYHLLDGRLSMKAEAMLAEFKVRGGKHEIVTRTPDCASIKLTIDGQTHTFALTWEEAQKEPFPYGKENKLKKNWATPRARMQTMWARVVSDGVRAMAPEIVTGTYTPEEIEDFEQPSAPPKQVFTQPAEPKKAVVTTATPPAPAPEPPKPVEPAVPTPPVIDAEFTELVKKAEVNAETGKLSPATVQTLAALINDQNCDKALAFIQARNPNAQIKTYFDVSVNYAQKIIDAPDKFITAIGGAK